MHSYNVNIDTQACKIDGCVWILQSSANEIIYRNNVYTHTIQQNDATLERYALDVKVHDTALKRALETLLVAVLPVLIDNLKGNILRRITFIPHEIPCTNNNDVVHE